jgi:Lsr2
MRGDLPVARHIVVTPVDDIDGSLVDVKTIHFTYGQAQYDIELSAANRKLFDEAMAPFLEAARRHRGNPGVRRDRLAYSMAREIRDWANANGEDIKPTGQLPVRVIDRYIKEHPGMVVHKK